MKQKIILFGNGDVAEVLSHYISQQYDICAYTVDDEYATEETFNGKPLVKLSEVADTYSPDTYLVLCTVGFIDLNKVRESAYNKMKALGYRFANYIDEKACAIGYQSIGENNIILDNVSVQPGTTISNGNILWSGSVLAHGSIMEDFNWVTSGTTIAGNVTIGNRNFFGVNCSVSHTKTINNDCIIGANTLVNSDLKQGQVILSEPGEIIKLDSLRFLKFSGM